MKTSKSRKTKEGNLKVDIMTYMNSLGFEMRNHAVGRFRSIFGNRIYTFGNENDPDLVGSFNGIRVWCEVKRKSEWPREGQIKRMRYLNNQRKEIAFWVDSISICVHSCVSICKGYRINMKSDGRYSFYLPSKEGDL